MSKKLDREFGRFDVDFLDSDEYLSMPRAVRNHAYLYLLALSGRSRKRRTDGLLSLSVAEDVARRMHQSGRALLAALQAVHMVLVEGDEVVVLKYAKWQQTKAEIEQTQQDARDRQSRHRHGDVTPPVTPMSRPSHSNVTPVVTRLSQQSHATEKEIEKERDLSLPSPSLVDKSVEGTGVKTPKRLEMPHLGYRGGEMSPISVSLPKASVT